MSNLYELFPNDKKYIGQHYNNNINERKQTHKHQYNYFCKKKIEITENPNSTLRNPIGFCTALYGAFKKYSFKKCVWVVLEDNIPLNKINEIEDNYIIELKTMQPNGYNLKLNNSNDEYKSFSIETLKRMSISQSKVFETKLDNYRKYNTELKNMPKHVKYINRGDKYGYQIDNHPNCKSKYFLTTTDSIDILKQRVLDFLKQCEITPHKSSYEIQKKMIKYQEYTNEVMDMKYNFSIKVQDIVSHLHHLLFRKKLIMN